MAIVKMSKMRLVFLDYHKEVILNAMQKTGVVELTNTEEFDETVSCNFDVDKEKTSNALLRIEKTIEFIENTITASKRKEYYPKDANRILENFFVSYDEFISAKQGEEYLLPIISETEEFQRKLVDNLAKKSKLINARNQVLPYLDVTDKFSDFKNTRYSTVFFGIIKKDAVNGFVQYVNGAEAVYYISENANAVVCVATLNENKDELSQKLAECGFVACPFYDNLTPTEKLQQIDDAIAELELSTENIYKSICGFSAYVRPLKILADYYGFSYEKQESQERFRRTGKTLVAEGYVPTEDVEKVKSVINEVTDAVFMEFCEPKDDEETPTLTRNGKLVRQTEFVTDLYSSPNYREIDPNKVMFFFFMLFMGIIMADIGYGILMTVIGFALASRIKVDNGAKRLWNVIAIGGVFTILFGILFNSLFGFSILPFTVLPSPAPNLKTGVINMEIIMTYLLLCLALGAIQIAVGYVVKALNLFKQGKILDGLLDGLVWTIFFVGLIFATFNFLCDYLKVGLPTWLSSFFGRYTTAGLIVVIACVGIAALTAGRHEKGFGKFSKGFGAVYGLINIMSDILSYARLFGLMLSGMIIAQTFNFKLGIPIMESGGAGVVLGVVVIVVGHAFNLAMSVLGAYIHDSRLQYIEFFSKFYTGEGRKFTPFGSKTKYIYVKK